MEHLQFAPIRGAMITNETKLQRVNPTPEIYEMVIEIIGTTSDGNQLSARHLELTQSAINGFCTEEGINELRRVYQMVIDNNYVNWFHNIEGMVLKNNGYVKYKGEILDHYSFTDWEAEHAAVIELYTRCQHIELLGLKPTQHNCVHYWQRYAKLQPNSVGSANPWVRDDFICGTRIWRQIDEKHYNHYFHNAIVETIGTNAFMVTESETDTSDGQAVYMAVRESNGKYYAQLMTLREFKTRRYEAITEYEYTPNWYCGIEHMFRYYDGRIRWKGVMVDYDADLGNEKITPQELHTRCLHIESLGFRPSMYSCIHNWHEEYKDIQPGTIGSASPWVHEDYNWDTPQWRQISEEYYDLYKDEIGLLRMGGNSFLGGDEWNHTEDRQSVHIACKYEDGKCYAQLMTLKQYEAYINSKQ